MTSNALPETVGVQPPIPMGIRIASALCWLIGILSLAFGFRLYTPSMLGVPVLLIPFLLTMAGVIATCFAGYLAGRRRKSAAYLLVVALALPSISNLGAGAAASRTPWALLIAILALVANWRHLR